MKTEKEKLEKIILGVTGSLIGIAVLFLFVFTPNIKRIVSQRGKIQEAKTRVEKAKRELANFSIMKMDLEKMLEKTRKYEAESPGAGDSWLLSALNEISERTGVIFDKRERIGYTIEVGGYSLLLLELELKTSYHKLGEFINQLELNSRFVSIRALDITGNKEDINRHNVKLTVGAFVFVPKEINPVPQPYGAVRQLPKSGSRNF